MHGEKRQKAGKQWADNIRTTVICKWALEALTLERSMYLGVGSLFFLVATNHACVYVMYPGADHQSPF